MKIIYSHFYLLLLEEDFGYLEVDTPILTTIAGLQAYILEENIVSKKIFENLGFIYNNEKEICNDGLEYLVYKRI